MSIIIFQSLTMWKDAPFFASLLLIIRLAVGQTFGLNLSHALVLTTNTTIEGINFDFQGRYLVGFADGQVRRYASDFSTYDEFTFPDVIQYFGGRTYTGTAVLSNGTTVTLNDKMLVTRSKDKLTVRDYNYNTYALLFSYTTSSAILHEMGCPLTVNGQTRTYHLTITTDAILVIFMGTLSNTLSWTSLFGASTTCLTTLYYSAPLAQAGDVINASHYYYVSLSNDKVYLLIAKVGFTFDFPASHYTVTSVVANFYLLYSSPSPITYLKIAGGLIMMQANATGATTIVNITNSAVGVTTNLPTNQTMNFFYGYGYYYLVQSSGVYKLNYDQPTSTLSLDSTLSTHPDDTYATSAGSNFHVVYTPGKTAIYKGGFCTGQSYLSSGACVSYNCSVANCAYCFISPSICTICQNNYVLDNATYACSGPQEETPQEPTPVAAALAYAVDLFAQILPIPSARKLITPLFFYFGIFDDLYIYQFHDRLYGSTMDDMFGSINGIESKKWSLFNYRKVLTLMELDPTPLDSIINFQDAYDDYPFADPDHTDVGSEGLWSNCQNYFIITIPLTLIGFVLFRLLFRALYNYPASKLLRRFDFWPFFVLMLLEGNVQQLGFFMYTDLRIMFSFGFSSKWLKAYSVLFSFVVVLGSTSLFFASYHLYGKLNRHLTDNHRNDLLGVTMLALQGGFKNLVLGVLHSMLRSLEYYHMLSIILAYELLFGYLLLACVWMGVYRMNAQVWFFFVLNLLKLLIVATFLVDYHNTNVPVIETTQQMLILVIVLVFALGILHELVLSTAEMLSMAREIFGKREKVVGEGVGVGEGEGEGEGEKKSSGPELTKKGVLVYVPTLHDKPVLPNIIISSATQHNLPEEEKEKCKKFKAGEPKPAKARYSFNIKYIPRNNLASTILPKN